jgi:hypothetical protein
MVLVRSVDELRGRIGGKSNLIHTQPFDVNFAKRWPLVYFYPPTRLWPPLLEAQKVCVTREKNSRMALFVKCASLRLVNMHQLDSPEHMKIPLDCTLFRARFLWLPCLRSNPPRRRDDLFNVVNLARKRE